MRLYLPDFSEILLSGKSGTDGDSLSKSDRAGAPYRKRDGARRLLRHRNHRADRKPEGEKGHWRGIE